MMSIVNMSNLLVLVLSQKTACELGLEWMEDIARCIGEAVKWSIKSDGIQWGVPFKSS